MLIAYTGNEQAVGRPFVEIQIEMPHGIGKCTNAGTGKRDGGKGNRFIAVSVNNGAAELLALSLYQYGQQAEDDQ